jgi:peptidoglycan-associated lipoprotein
MLKVLSKVGMTVVLLGALMAVGCGPKYPNCKGDEHCKDKGEFCVNQKCVECATKDHCVAKTGDACMTCGAGNTCAKIPRCCHSDLDCPGGKCWKSEGAATGMCGGECKSSADCKDGFECIGERCVKRQAGCEETGCGPAKKCVNGACVWLCDMAAVYFDFNESTITKAAKAALEQNVECAKTLGVAIRVEGHCDERGTDEYNMALGDRRATRTMKFLKDRGITTPLSKISYGEERPVCSQAAENCWSRNRRSEFVPTP